MKDIASKSATSQICQPLQATLTDRQCDHQTTEKKPAAHFSTFGFARHTSRPFARPKELKSTHLSTVEKYFLNNFDFSF